MPSTVSPTITIVAKTGLRIETRVIHMGPDPLFSRFPVRNFRCDVAVAGESDVTVPALIDARAGVPRDEAAIAASGVDLISCGWITHSAPCLDIGLDFDSLTAS